MAQLVKKLEQQTNATEAQPTTGNAQQLAQTFELLLQTGNSQKNRKAIFRAGLALSNYYEHVDSLAAILTLATKLKTYEDKLDKDISVLLCQIRNAEASVYVRKNDYQRGLGIYMQALDIAENYQLNEEKAQALNNIAVLYIRMYDPKKPRNTKKGLDYAQQAIESIKKLDGSSPDKQASLVTAYINYGDLLNSYGTDTGQKEYQLKAMNIFRKGIELAGNDQESKVYLYANLAYTYKNLGDKPNYLKYLQQAYVLMNTHKNLVSAYVQQGVNFALGEYYSKTNNTEKALFHLKKAEELLKKDASPDYQMMSLIYGMANTLHAQMGNYKTAYQYQKNYWRVKDSLLNAETLLKFEEMEVKYQSEKKGRQLKETALKLQNASLVRNAVIVIALLLALSLFLFYHSYKNKNRALQVKKEAADIALEKAEVELQANRQMLEQYTTNLIEKNRLIDDLQQLAETGNVDDAALSKLSNSRILTRDDWDEYKKLFDKVYPGFFIKLRRRYPDITEADERILAFSKLNINLKEAANLLGISYVSMKNSRYRLRKKIGIDNDTDFKEITEML